VQPTRVPKPGELDGFNAYIRASADSAAREAVIEATDPDELAARRREARLTRLLIAMVLAIIIGGFVISIAGIILTGGSPAGAGQ
jgi:hypothetical protein